MHIHFKEVKSRDKQTLGVVISDMLAITIQSRVKILTRSKVTTLKH